MPRAEAAPKGSALRGTPFTRDDPARDVDRFFREQGGIVRYEDLAGYESRLGGTIGHRASRATMCTRAMDGARGRASS